jgi:hypothetical protein
MGARLDPLQQASAWVHMLWTGGWDSTFRLLQLALLRGRAVQPHYIVDTGRPSTLHELRAIHAIREGLRDLSIDAARRVAPLHVVSIHDIAPDPVITGRYARLRSRGPLGTQYDWLARFVRQYGVRDLELCIHVDDKAEAFVRPHVALYESRDGDGWWALSPSVEHDPDLALFESYRFPLLRLSKLEMREIARAQGLLPLMLQTWFCHSPVGESPCGRCNPCVYTVEEGMGDRLQAVGMRRYRRDALRRRLAATARRVLQVAR